MDTPHDSSPGLPQKVLRGIAHHLDPIVTITDKGLTQPVVAELDRALGDHELVKIRISVADRVQRREIGDAASAATRAAIVQRIGKIAVLYRHNPDAKPALSNIARFGEA